MTNEEALDKFDKEILYPYLNRVWKSWDKTFEKYKEEIESLKKEACMTLLQKIEKAENDAEKVLKDYPDIDRVQYTFHNIPASEIKEAEKTIKDATLHHEPSLNKVFLAVHSHSLKVAIFAFSSELKNENIKKTFEIVEG